MLRKVPVITVGAGVAVALVVALGAGCWGDCPYKYVESGGYEMSAGPYGQEWLDGAVLTVDREAGTAKIRYTREGSTYEVTFTLDE